MRDHTRRTDGLWNTITLVLFLLLVLLSGCGDRTTTATPVPPPPATVEQQQSAVEYYTARRRARDTVVARVEQSSGRKLADWSRADYSHWLNGLDLNRDDDLWQWSHVTGIPIIGVARESTFFYNNAHLIDDVDLAMAMTYQDLVALKRGTDTYSGQPTLHTADGHPLPIRDLPSGLIRQSVRSDGYSYDEDFAEPRTVLEAIAPYLVRLADVPNREAITEGLRALPLSIVKAYRGKAIYLTTRPGRSYSVGMPVSNSVYDAFVGMQAGVFIDPNRGSTVTHNVVHELGHIIDYTVIEGQYGTYLHPYRVPSFHALRDEKDRIFGSGGDRVPQTDYGYISHYARANAQESFAEHFANYILNRGGFFEKALFESNAGHPELMEKYRFLETLVDDTPVDVVRLSQDYLATLVHGDGRG